ncbi:MAG: hypothetical protein Q9199_007035 [Rusavskia elegans]
MASLASPSNSRLTCLANGTTYDTVLIEPKQNNPYILFLHGFPASSYDWRRQISFFSNLGYGVFAPDLLGYGGTDKPSQLEAYKLKQMSEDIVSLLDHHDIKEVIAVGHDWGSFLLSRLANYHPERILAYIFLAVGYKPPYDHFDVDVINDLTQRRFGYPIFGYWHFFNSAEAADIMTEQIESSTTIIFPPNPDIWLEYLCPPGGIRKFYEKEMTGPLPDWISESEVAIYKQIFSAANGGYRGGLNWYKTQMANLNSVDEKAVPSDRRQTDKPALLVACTKDYVGIPSMQEESTRMFANDLAVESLDCGHWVQLEKANEVNEVLKSFIEKRLLKA